MNVIMTYCFPMEECEVPHKQSPIRLSASKINLKAANLTIYKFAYWPAQELSLCGFRAKFFMLYDRRDLQHLFCVIWLENFK